MPPLKLSAASQASKPRLNASPEPAFRRLAGASSDPRPLPLRRFRSIVTSSFTSCKGKNWAIEDSVNAAAPTLVPVSLALKARDTLAAPV